MNFSISHPQVTLLIERKNPAKGSACDKRGDTALHIAMRARSKAICEVLLRNPKNGHLLYRPNKSGETPYNIDAAQQKSILQQIFGARKLNTHEENENMLGFVCEHSIPSLCISFTWAH